MSFRVETSPNHYNDYEIFSSARFNQIGQHFLSLINPNHGTTPNENEPISQNRLQQPSDLCRPLQEQTSYYLTNQDVIKQIKDNFIPHKSLFPYTSSSTTNNQDNDEQSSLSMLEWQATKQSPESTRYILSQIITIIQCRSKLSTSSLSAASQNLTRHAVRLFIDYQQHKQMETFLDIVNEALLLSPDTIKTLWDAKGEQVREKNFKVLFLGSCGHTFFWARTREK
jgi:hypothetical protein